MSEPDQFNGGEPVRSNGSEPERSSGGDPRDALARARDETGAVRDEEAALRDRLADAADAQVDEHERNGGEACGVRSGYVIRAARDRERAAADRAGAATQRAAAARDREFAARDRELAAADRAHAAAEIAAAGVDEMTGALRRGVGLASLRREVARAHRNGEPLVLAFVDVDGLKAVNDTRGHHAGDLLLESREPDPEPFAPVRRDRANGRRRVRLLPGRGGA